MGHLLVLLVEGRVEDPHLYHRQADGATGKARGFMLRTDNVPTSATIRVRRAKLERGSRPTDWSPAPQDSQAAGDYATNSSLTQTASQIRSEVAEKYQSKSGMSSYATTSALTQKANEITGKVQEVAKTAQGNTTTISQGQPEGRQDQYDIVAEDRRQGRREPRQQLGAVSEWFQNLGGAVVSAEGRLSDQDGNAVQYQPKRVLDQKRSREHLHDADRDRGVEEERDPHVHADRRGG